MLPGAPGFPGAPGAPDGPKFTERMGNELLKIKTSTTLHTLTEL